MSLTPKHFIDWESETFGYGYGSGEEHTLGALKTFFGSLDATNGANLMYDYTVLEKLLTPATAWLLINVLCHADIIDYGTSPRYAWINEKGKLVKEFMDGKTVDELYELTAGALSRDHEHCYRDSCNCDTPCNNPMWAKKG